jgi:DNA-binding beta-propeller fold protein YncE
MSLFGLVKRAILVLGLYSSATLALPTSATETAAEAQAAGGRLWVLGQARGKVFTLGPNGENPKDIVTGLRSGIDGIAVDKAGGYIYISSMFPGTIKRVKLDGTGLTTIVPSGVFQVGKQLILVTEGGVKKLYWADREGQKIMRANVDGSGVEIVVDTSRIACTGSYCKQAVGVAVDTKNGWVYWTQKGNGSGNGSIRRAPTTFQAGQTASTRSDIQIVLNKLPQPIDLKLIDGHGLYWTERSGPDGGNAVFRIALSSDTLAGKAQFSTKSQLVTGLGEAIGITADIGSGKIWFTDLGGKVYSANLDGTGKKTIASGQGGLTGIDYA